VCMECGQDVCLVCERCMDVCMSLCYGCVCVGGMDVCTRVVACVWYGCV